MYFLLFRIFEQLALALKNKVALEFLTVFKYFLLFRIFDQVALVLKTELAFKFPNPGGGGALPTPRLVRLWLYRQSWRKFNVGQVEVRP